jgi:DNA-binding transcriptional regulator YiaG
MPFDDIGKGRACHRKMLAHRLRVDPSTLALWERGQQLPTGIFLKRVQALFKARGVERWSDGIDVRIRL